MFILKKTLMRIIIKYNPVKFRVLQEAQWSKFSHFFGIYSAANSYGSSSVLTIRRKYKSSGWKGTLMVVNTVGHLAEAAFHHPDLTVSYAFVTVKLMNHAAKGITNKDFELAKIEDVVMWQPANEGGSLEGTPNDPRFKYIKYD